MNTLARIAGLLALALTLVPAALFAAGQLGQDPMKLLMLAGALLWFASAPFCLKGGT